jgi:chloride channel 7
MAHSLAAGVSTAFAAPIGGLLLAIEEGSSFLSLGLFWRGFLATCTGVVTLHFLAQCHASIRSILHTKFGVWRDLGCAHLRTPFV